MQNNFYDFSLPSTDVEYYCSDNEKCAGWTLLMKLVLMVHEYPDAIPIIKKLVVCYDTVNMKNNLNHTALSIICKNNTNDKNLDMIKLLIENNADVNHKDNDGKTVLHSSCVRPDCLNTVKTLINSKAKLNSQDKFGFTPLMRAVENSQSDSNINIIQLLINSGSNVNIKNISNETNLLYISRYYNNNYETMKLILNSKPDLSVTDNGGNTALMLSRQIAPIKLLLDVNCDIDVKNKLGQTFLMLFIIKILDDTDDHINILIDVMRRSKKTLLDKDFFNNSAYDYYKAFHHGLLGEYYLKILKGKIRLNNTKSSRSTLA